MLSTAKAIMLRLALSFLLVTSSALAEPWFPGLRPADQPRVKAYESTLGRAVAQALAEGAPSDVEALVAAMRGRPGILDPAGDWSCRTLKLGGLTPLTTYGAFRCRITATGPGTWRLEKTTGSQRLLGEIRAANGLAVYLGVGYVDGGPAVSYAELPPDDQTPVEPGQTVAQVGFFEQAGPGQARLLLPSPLLESDLDILWLTR